MNSTLNPPPQLLPILEKTKSAYLTWYGFYQILPKTHRHTLGEKIDRIFVDVIEAIVVAAFSSREDKLPWVRLAIRKMDLLRIFLLILWETKSIDNKKYIALSMELDKIGKMLGGWNGQLVKQNSPAKAGEK